MTDQELERRRYEELLQELRVMLPGVEILFAFLLSAVFASRFTELDDLGKTLFGVALTSAVLTVLIMLVPASLHRVGDMGRARRVRVAARFQVIGSVTLGITLCVGFFVVTRLMFSTAPAAWLTALVASTWIGLWYVMPRLLDRS